MPGPGWKNEENAWVGQYYVGEDGVRVKDAWVDDCYLGSNGKKVTNSWVGDYYVGENGKKLTNTWQDGYYLDEEERSRETPGSAIPTSVRTDCLRRLRIPM